MNNGRMFIEQLPICWCDLTRTRAWSLHCDQMQATCQVRTRTGILQPIQPPAAAMPNLPRPTWQDLSLHQRGGGLYGVAAGSLAQSARALGTRDRYAPSMPRPILEFSRGRVSKGWTQACRPFQQLEQPSMRAPCHESSPPCFITKSLPDHGSHNPAVTLDT